MSAEAGGNFEEAQRSYEGLITMKDEEIKTLKVGRVSPSRTGPRVRS